MTSVFQEWRKGFAIALEGRGGVEGIYKGIDFELQPLSNQLWTGRTPTRQFAVSKILRRARLHLHLYNLEMKFSHSIQVRRRLMMLTGRPPLNLYTVQRRTRLGEPLHCIQ